MPLTSLRMQQASRVVVEYDIEYLMIGGGGGGCTSYAWAGGAGGGAGGYLTATGFTIDDATTYTITVGAGSPQAADDAIGSQGSSTTFSTLTAYGGGRGKGYFGNATATGGATTSPASAGELTATIGSGGGKSTETRDGGEGPNYTWNSTQGNSGGASADYAQCGGGGAGAAAVNRSYTNAPTGENGGNGLASSITGSSITRAGGGGGGGAPGYGTAANTSGGSGGGGIGGGEEVDGGAGTVNTGSGGGGGSGNNGGATNRYNNGGAGGSGLVVLKIPTVSYSGVTTGSPTISTSGSNTILIYNGTGTYKG